MMSTAAPVFYGTLDGYWHHNGTIGAAANASRTPVAYKDQPFWSRKAGCMLTYPAWVCPDCGDQW